MAKRAEEVKKTVIKVVGILLVLLAGVPLVAEHFWRWAGNPPIF